MHYLQHWNKHISQVGSGYPLVFLHGWGFDHRIAWDLALSLKEKFRFYLVDLPGANLSPLIPWESFKASLLASLPKRFALVGWSMGGLYTTRLALDAPCRVSHLINIASSPFFMKEGDWPGIEKSDWQVLYDEIVENPLMRLERFIKDTHSPLENQLRPAHQSLETLLSGLEILANWDLRSSLAAIACPTYYLFGRYDSIVPKTTCDVMRDRYPDFKYTVFARSAHAPFLSHPSLITSELESFIS